MVHARRKTPEELLREAESHEAAIKKGYLKIFLGYASGVGKSFRMLDEARRRRERGQDVVVGAVQPQVSPEVERLLTKLEVIPLRHVDGGTAVDREALLERHPDVCFIDGLAYDNPPGSRNATRWEVTKELVQAGIKVIASINIQYVSELREQIDRPVRMEPVPRETWESLFKSQGMKNSTPRIQMIDGFNEGWIEFESGEADSRKGKVPSGTVLQALIERERE